MSRSTASFNISEQSVSEEKLSAEHQYNLKAYQAKLEEQDHLIPVCIWPGRGYKSEFVHMLFMTTLLTGPILFGIGLYLTLNNEDKLHQVGLPLVISGVGATALNCLGFFAGTEKIQPINPEDFLIKPNSSPSYGTQI